ncbi:MAG: hypothetical protein RJA63_45 [Pseudomonadota bacterium]
MNEAQRLAKAKANFEAAWAESSRLQQEAEKVTKQAREAVSRARDEMNAAQLDADQLLPTCVRHYKSGRDGLTVDRVVVVKRTPKSVTVKSAGCSDDNASLFKADKDGVYRISPKPTGYWAPTIWIEFPDETSAPDPA